MTAEMKVLSLRLDGEQARALELVARAQGTSLTQAIREAIDAYINARRANRAFMARLEQMLAAERETLDRLAR